MQPLSICCVLQLYDPDLEGCWPEEVGHSHVTYMYKPCFQITSALDFLSSAYIGIC